MTQKEFTKAVVETTNKNLKSAGKNNSVSESLVSEVIKAEVDVTTKALKKGDKISIAGFGTFQTSKRAARTGRNPQTGAEIKIPASIAPKFKAGKALKDAVNK